MRVKQACKQAIREMLQAKPTHQELVIDNPLIQYLIEFNLRVQDEMQSTYCKLLDKMSGMEELARQHEETKNQLAELEPKIKKDGKGLLFKKDLRRRNDVSHLSNDDLEDLLISAARM